MAHFAKVCDGRVLTVIVAEPEFFDDFVDDVPGDWIQTSYNTLGGVHYEANTNYQTPSADQTKALRYNYASIGGHYDAEADAFYRVQPYASWVLNKTNYLWEAPVPMPADADTVSYLWDEENLTWTSKNIE